MRWLIFVVVSPLLVGIGCSSMKKQDVAYCGTTNEGPATLYYTDQNNNRFHITETTFAYFPITEKESSSGTYNGGEPVSGPITLEKFASLLKAAETLLKENSLVTTRRMLTARLSIKRGTTTEAAILKKSSERTAFELLLTALKDSSE